MEEKKDYIDRYHEMSLEQLFVEFLRLEAAIKRLQKMQYVLRLIRAGKTNDRRA